MTLNLACAQLTTQERIERFCQCKVDQLTLAGYTIDDIIDAASDTVVIATGGRITGRCESTVRPCADTSCVCGRSSDTCMCCRLDAIRLPGDAITIVSVKIDGAELSDGTYGWLDGDGLIRLGEDRETWPGCQHLQRADTEEGTFSITYEYGLVPFVAVMAATEIACDLISGITRKTSRLDPRVVTAIMDGVTVELDPTLLGMFEWAQRLVSQYPAIQETVVYSPEIADQWQLHTVTPA